MTTLLSQQGPDHRQPPQRSPLLFWPPPTLVDEALRGNGVQTANDTQAIPYAKLRAVFGADPAVYLKMSRHGTSYRVANSETRVDVQARIVD